MYNVYLISLLLENTCNYVSQVDLLDTVTLVAILMLPYM